MSLSRQILTALVAGVLLGLLLGDSVAFLQVGGRAFVQLLQITVLPFVAGSLIHGFGSLGGAEARRVFTRGGALLLVLWALTLLLVFLSPLALPAGLGGAFYAKPPREAEAAIDWLQLYIPANPFHALANNVVPAVVVFAVLAGVALMGMKDKAELLRPIAVFNEAMGRVAMIVARTTPLGIFAIAAHTAGTMRLEEFERLQGFLLVYAGLASLLTFVLLPGLVAATTHVTERRLVGAAQDALVTAFVTSNLFIVLPLIVERSKALLAEGPAPVGGAGPAAAGAPPSSSGSRDAAEAELVDVLVPTSFNFPHSAKVLSVSFVPFVAWYAGLDLDLSEYPTLAGAGLLAVFGSINAAIPFLLDLVRLPADPFQLFVVAGVLNSRFGAMAAAMHTFVIAVLGTCLITGRLRPDRPRLVRFALASLVLVAAFLGGTRLVLARVLPHPPTREQVLAAMSPRPPLAAGATLADLPSASVTPPEPGQRLELVRASGRIRVGFDPDSLPWAFLNAEGEPVGFDAEQAHQLALALGVRLEHAAAPRDRLLAALASGQLDVVMSGVRVSARATERVAFTRPYAEEQLAFLVPDHLRARFVRVEQIRARRLRIAILDRPEWLEALTRALPLAEVVPVRSAREFVEGRVRADALLTTWERASGWSLLFPELGPALPEPRLGHVPLAYAVPHREPELLNALDTFVDVQRASGRLESARSHWILGEATQLRGRRWSILRDGLGFWPEQR